MGVAVFIFILVRIGSWLYLLKNAGGWAVLFFLVTTLQCSVLPLHIRFLGYTTNVYNYAIAGISLLLFFIDIFNRNDKSFGHAHEFSAFFNLIVFAICTMVMLDIITVKDVFLFK